jgi:hypothetical protein
MMYYPYTMYIQNNIKWGALPIHSKNLQKSTGTPKQNPKILILT